MERNWNKNKKPGFVELGFVYSTLLYYILARCAYYTDLESQD